MPAVLHGIGTDNVPPFVPILGHTDFQMPEGQFEENMVVAVECYAGRTGAQDGVKLEDEIWITAGGPVKICHYPYERKLLD
jgi:Xaa-Pro aminopeptidase